MQHDKTTRLILIRHAQSLANVERRIQGTGDSPLSLVGEEQARRLAAWMRANSYHADHLFASPLRRAQQTAEAVGAALDLPVQLRPGLREMDMGKLEDMSEDDLPALLEQAPSDAAFEQQYAIEPAQHFTERTLGTLHGLLAAHDGSTIIVVTHLGVICTALAYWIDRNVSACWDIYGHIGNTALNEVIFHERIELLHHGLLPHLENSTRRP
jgi:broad specificity phosphatase PhoE